MLASVRSPQIPWTFRYEGGFIVLWMTFAA